MGSQANITINDGKTTPVSHTYYTNGAGWSDSVGGILASWVDRSAAAAVGFWKLSLSFKEPNKQRKNYIVVAKSEVPVLENVSNSTVSGIAPAPTVSYNPISKSEFSMPERSTSDSRKDQLAIHRNFIAHAVVTSAVVDLEPTT